jgi:hypothetical protein
MPMLSNPRHDSGHSFVTSGNASAAYRESGSHVRNADVVANQLVRTNGIAERIAELKAAQAKKSELSRDELREFLTELILTPAGKVNEQSRLCQSYKVTPEVREIRMPDKLRAVERFAKLCGFNEPEKMELEHGYKAQQELLEVIARLRGRGAARNDQSTG